MSKKIHKALRLCLYIATTLILVQTVCAKEIRTANDCNEIMMDRYNIVDDVREYKEVKCVLSFYSTLNVENGFGSIDAKGNPLKFGTIAIPREIPLGTEFSFDYFGHDTLFVGTDRGKPKHIRITENGTYRIDVCIPKKNGMTDKEYWKYVNNMGKVETMGRIYLD